MIEANKRNTEMKIAKIFIENSFSKEKLFSKNEIASTLFVKEKEFEAFKDDLFVVKDDNYTVKPEFYKKIEIWKEKHQANKDQIDTAINEYKKLFRFNYNKWLYSSRER